MGSFLSTWAVNMVLATIDLFLRMSMVNGDVEPPR
jgi:hypothetical protein